MESMELYNAFRSVPENAMKKINGGRLSGMTDINPVWRIQTLTERFGPCGFGWKYVVVKKWTEQGANGEIAAFVDIDLYYKVGGEWSEPIPGTGGASFVAKERNGLYTSDECFKMALTDAISVACKALGVGADVYWSAGRTKYSNQAQGQAQGQFVCEACGKKVTDSVKRNGEPWPADEIAGYGRKRFGKCLCVECLKRIFVEHKKEARQ